MPQPRTAESRRRTSAALVAYWSDPAKRTAHGALTCQRMDRPDVRERISERTAAAHNVPGMRERKLAGLARAFADPELRRKISVATKAGMAAKAEREVAALKGAWDAAPASVRRRFLAEINSIAGTGLGI
jgi:predicted TIM-barrel fold metal-dependent hydrolase